MPARSSSHDSDSPQAQAAWFATLDELTVLRVAGGDAESFLQGQLSNDVRELAAPANDQPRGHAAQLSSLSNARGRVLATLLVVRHHDDYLLVLPTAVAESVANRLRMFVLRARVEITPAADLRAVGLCGAALLDALLDGAVTAPPWSTMPLRALPGHEGAALRSALCVRFPDGPAPRALLLASADLSLEALPAAAGVMADWWRCDVRAGLPSVFAETQEKFVAQMLNLDQLGGISFSKGCYTGQEVIARTHYLGRVKRRLRRFGFPAGTEVAAGDEIVSPGSGGDGSAASAGVVALVSDAADRNEPGELLAVIQLDYEGQPLVLAAGGAELGALPLPPPLVDDAGR
jgi:folate-binding protein YgfZ